MLAEIETPPLPARRKRGRPTKAMLAAIPPLSVPASTTAFDPVVLGTRMRELRRAAGMSQIFLSAAASVSNVSLCHWEKGDKVPLLTSVWRVAAALNIAAVDLLAPDPVQPKPPRGRSLPFGEALRAARLIAGLTPNDLARRLEISPASQIERWETEESELTLGMLWRTASALQISVRQLLLTQSAGRVAQQIWSEAIGRRLHAARTRSGRSAAKIAATSGVTVLTIIRWEHGKWLPHFALLCRVADVLGVSAADLLDPLPRGVAAPGTPVVLGRNIQAARVASRLSHDQLARRLKLGSSSILRRIERDEHDLRLTTLQRLSEILNYSMRTLLIGQIVAPAVTASFPQDSGKTRELGLRRAQSKLADRLRLARINAGHTTDSLARLMKIHYTAVIRWESTGDIDIDWLTRFARALNISADLLLGLPTAAGCMDTYTPIGA